MATPSDPATPGSSARPSADAVRRLADAITRLSAHGAWLVDALTEAVLGMAPVSAERMPPSAREFLLDSGDFTGQALAETERQIGQGALQLGIAETFLFDVCSTRSLSSVAGFLHIDEDDVRALVAEGRLYAVELAGRLRFPTWQFCLPAEGHTLPGLPEVIKAIKPRWEWQEASAFMRVTQQDLVGTGCKTPTQWLIDGGGLSDVVSLIEASDWLS